MRIGEEKRNEIISNLKEVAKAFATGKTNFLTILFTVFVTLKLTGYISWSWWWVTAPLWGGFALFFIIIIFIFLILFLTYLLS